jgi:N-formylglutamate amidohydrolase
MKYLIGFILAFIVSFTSVEYVKYIPGDSNIVLSIPHGGKLKPTNLPDRTCEGCKTKADSYTKELGLQIDRYLRKRGYKAHIVYTDLHRSKVDNNRDITEGSTKGSRPYWKKYHTYLNRAINSIDTSQIVYFIDLHGQAHSHGKQEFGYNISKTIINSNDKVLDSYKDKSTVNALEGDLSEIMEGPKSLGCLMEDKYDIYPSCDHDRIPPQDKYFNGGYNVEHYTNHYDNVVGIQVECSKQVRFGRKARSKFAKEFAKELINFIRFNK